MKREIEDYINKGDYAVLCSSIEEWNAIVDLINKNHVSTTTQPYSKTKSNVLNLQNLKVTIGTGILKSFPNYTIYPASDFLEEEPKFEEGKWYKNIGKDNKAYAKCKKFEQNQFYISDYIGHNKRYTLYTNDGYFNKENYEKAELLIDLSEIQQYLPPNHPDLIVKLTSFPLEGYVYDDVNNLDNLSKYLVNRPFNTPNNNTVKKNAVGIARNTTSCWWLKTKTSGKTEYKLSDLESFLPKTEIIPEYVKLLPNFDNNNTDRIFYTKGAIPKMENWSYRSWKHLFEIHSTYFKESTKEAFDLQNKPKQLTVDDLIKGGIYVLDINKNKDFISKFDCIESDNYYDCCFIHKNEFENDPDSLTISEIRNIRLATNEEKKWLNTCITQDKFISKSDLHLYDESGLLIKKEEAMFKKNDYIVVLYNDNSLNSWTNQCFKQLEDLYYLKVVKNLNGNTDGWSVINFENQSKWRYASSAEILEYERIGKPFDVTTLIKKEKSLVKQVEEGLKLKDRWVKCVKECGWITINVGEYIQILENNSLVPYVEWKDNKEKYCIDLDRIDKAEFELMPEGFSPNEKEWIHNQYPLTPIESFQPSIYDLKDIHIPSITKKTKKLQTITIESTTDLNLNLTKIKSKQIQTIKI